MKRRRSAVTTSSAAVSFAGTRYAGRNHSDRKFAGTHLRRDPAAKLERDRVRELRRRRRRNAPIPDYLVKYEDVSRPGRRRRPPMRPDASRLTGNRSLRPLAWTALLPGVVVDAWIPYSDGTGYKRRPAVVVRVVGGRVQVYPVTSKVRRFACAGSRGLVVSDVVAAGLPTASAVVWRVVEIDRREVLRRRGALCGPDLDAFARRTAATALPNPPSLLIRPRLTCVPAAQASSKTMMLPL